ncbi:ABC transporter permease [Rhizobium paknamense]|uniref:Simple sugar transport system permease protein n=1 Tax=Rhizobium paknamense TaxID=1206817 RepID=A0ABU0IBK8_9HYPH|nr:ABC transporter permease [Rhizobium paknamense]MDQ0455612.1 simple sugar transport system permease protein [Rhizobium paknamense]
MNNSVTTKGETSQRLSLRFRKDGLLPRILLALALSLAVAALLILLAQKNPLEAFAAMLAGAFGSPHQIGVALNRTSPYLFAGAGLALCFRAGVINMGSDGQIAMGGIGATAIILAWPGTPGAMAAIAALIAAAVTGGLWAGLATAIHLYRRVHEVLATLLLNFVALLLVQLLLSGALGQPGAGFLQSPLMPRSVWLPRLPSFDFHIGIILAVIAAVIVSFLLWKTTFGFAVRVAGRSRPAAAYAGFSIAAITWQLMLGAGAMAGLGGGVEILGLQHRLIEGFSSGFGFKAVTVALLGALEPALTIPAALFVGFLETGALAMQRQIGVPSSLVTVIEAATMLFILAATVRRS